MKHIGGLGFQLIKLIILSMTVSIVFSILFYMLMQTLTNRLILNTEIKELMVGNRVDNLKKYVTDNSISTYDSEKIQIWCSKQPMVLMEVYRDNYLIFNSNYESDELLNEQNIEVTHYDWYSYLRWIFWMVKQRY